MRNILAFIVIIGALALTTPGQAQNYKWGMGVRLTSSTATVSNAVSFKYFFNEANAFEGLVSFDPTTIGGLYEHHRQLGVSGLQWFFGGGAYFSFDSSDDDFGAMGIIGLDYKFATVPLNLSIDWKPELTLAKDIGFEAATLGLGIRFAF